MIILPWFIYKKKKDVGESDIQATDPEEETQTNRHNLPAQLTTFIGREKEMQLVRELISEYRLLTLTGAGGCGKTRMACEAAATMVQYFKDGVWFVDGKFTENYRDRRMQVHLGDFLTLWNMW